MTVTVRIIVPERCRASFSVEAPGWAACTRRNLGPGACEASFRFEAPADPGVLRRWTLELQPVGGGESRAIPIHVRPAEPRDILRGSDWLAWQADGWGPSTAAAPSARGETISPAAVRPARPPAPRPPIEEGPRPVAPPPQPRPQHSPPESASPPVGDRREPGAGLARPPEPSASPVAPPIPPRPSHPGPAAGWATAPSPGPGPSTWREPSPEPPRSDPDPRPTPEPARPRPPEPAPSPAPPAAARPARAVIEDDIDVRPVGAPPGGVGRPARLPLSRIGVVALIVGIMTLGGFGLRVYLAKGPVPEPRKVPGETGTAEETEARWRPGAWTLEAGGAAFAMIAVEGGAFEMGDEPGEPSASDPLRPIRHRVTLRPYHLAEAEIPWKVVVAYWREVPAGRPAGAVPPADLDLPAHLPSFRHWASLLNWLSEKSGRRPFYDADGRPPGPDDPRRRFGDGLRLPTEAEMEFALRKSGDPDGRLPGLVAVAEAPKDEGGFRGLRGNFWELTGDWLAPYDPGVVDDPVGPPAGSKKVLRGGRHTTPSRSARAVARNAESAASLSDVVGARVATFAGPRADLMPARSSGK